MSSLLQFNGAISSRGVRLEACIDGGDTYTCKKCNKQHDVVYGFWRKPCGQFGAWVQFRINGKIHAPDLSVPITVGFKSWHSLHKLPRDAKPLNMDEYNWCES